MNKILLIPAALAAVFAIPAQATSEVWHDNSYEILIDQNGALTTSFAVGDILVGVVGITTYTGSNPVPLNLTGIYATQVTSETAITGAACGGLGSCAAFTFGAVGSVAGGTVATYTAAINSLYSDYALVAPSLAHIDANTAITWWNDPAALSTSNNIATTLGTTLGGTQVATHDLGTASNPLNNVLPISGPTATQQYWTAVGPANILQTIGLNTSTTIGSYGFQVTQTWAAFPLANYLPDSIFTGNGTIAPSGGNGLTTFAIQDQANIASITVPEPSILALLGMGLLGFGAKKSGRKFS